MPPRSPGQGQDQSWRWIWGILILAILAIAVGGPLSTAIRQYALVFYGARYTPLGNLLYPPPPEPAILPQT